MESRVAFSFITISFNKEADVVLLCIAASLLMDFSVDFGLITYYNSLCFVVEFMELCMKPKQSTTTLAHTNAEVSHANESLTTSAINESVDHASPKHRSAAGSVIPVTYVIVIVVGMAIIAFPFCLGFNWNTFKKSKLLFNSLRFDANLNFWLLDMNFHIDLLILIH